MREVLAIEQQVAIRIAHQHAATAVRIEQMANGIARDAARIKFADAREAARWLSNEPRWRALQKLARDDATPFARFAGDEIAKAQADLVQLAQVHGEALMIEQLPPGAFGFVGQIRAVSVDAVNQLVGVLQPDSPLWNLKGIADQQMTKIGQALIRGAAQGQSPRLTARAIAKQLDGNLVRALNISRTETMRSYREAGREQILANPEVCTQWTWVAKLDRRTCASCWALSGTVFPADTPMGSHPSCRCALTPRTKSWEELGFHGMPDTRQPIALGADTFAQQDAATQRAVLGPQKYADYKAGKITLGDTVKSTQTAEWGTTRTVASRAQTLKNAG